MSTKLYVGNLSFSVTSDDLGNFFAQIGNVASARVMSDRETGRSKGFGFVEMESEESAQEAVAKLDGQNLQGRPLRVNEARPQEPRRDGGGGGGGRGFGGGGGGGGGFGGGGGGGNRGGGRGFGGGGRGGEY